MSGFLISRAKQILKSRGFVFLIKRALLYLSLRLFIFRRFYLYEHTLQARDEADYMPKIQGVTLKVVSTNRQADEIVNQGFEDFRDCPVILNARRCLEKGAVAFCFFVGSEFAHVGFVAMDKEAKKSFDILPYRVDFAHGQACTGGTITMPKYRSNGLMAYGYFKRLEFLHQKGYKTSRNAVNINNKVSQRVHAKFGPGIYARARLLKIAWLTFWKVTPYRSAAGDILQNQH